MGEVTGAEAWIMVALVVGVLTMAAASCILVFIALLLRFRAVNEQRIRRRRFATWRPLLHAVIEDNLDARFLTSSVARGDRGLFLEFLLEYSRVLRGPESERIVALGQDFADGLIPAAMSKDETRRALAVEALGTFGMGRHRHLLLAALEDESNLVAMIAAHALAAHGSAIGVAAVLDRLDRFGFWDRRHLSSFLHRIGPDNSAALIVIMTDRTRPISARVAAVETLQHMGEARAADVAVSMLQADEDAELHCACLRLLGEVGRPEHAAIIRPLFARPEDFLRMHAVTSWASLVDRSEAAPLVDAMSDESKWVAIRAAQSLHDLRRFDILEQIGASDHPRAELARSMMVAA